MLAIRARIVALLASAVIATLTSWGIRGLGPEAHGLVETWVNHSFDLLLFLGYVVLHPLLQRRINPTGAITTTAARKLEEVAQVKPE